MTITFRVLEDDLAEQTAPAQLSYPLGDVDKFSLTRWLLARYLETQTKTPARLKAPWEAQWYAAQEKALTELNGQDGGFLAPEGWRMKFYDIIRGAMALTKLPITTETTNARVTHIPVATGEWKVTYPAPNTTITSGDRTFGQHTFTMKKQAAFGTVSQELIQDDGALADKWLQKSCGEALAHDRDTQALIGSGVGGVPVGLLSQSNVQQYTLLNDAGNGATPKYQDIVQCIANVRNLGQSANVPSGTGVCSGIVGATRFAQTVDNMTDNAGRPYWPTGLSNEKDTPGKAWFLGIPNWIMTSNIPVNVTKGTASDCSYLFFGDWQYFIMMSRLDFEFLWSAAPLLKNGQFLVRGLSRWDCEAMHPEAFVAVQGVRL